MGPSYLNLFNGRISITLNIVRLVDKDLHNSSKSKARWLYLNPRDLARAKGERRSRPFWPVQKETVANWRNAASIDGLFKVDYS